jgi:3-oxoacyl-[acyl-carrier protein] reductase
MTAIVTGASRGIGRATALALAARGLRVALLGRTRSELEETQALAAERGGRADVLQCDLRDPAQIAGAAARILETAGPPAVLAHVAGVIHRVHVPATTDEQWADTLDVNLRAPFLLTRALLPRMLEAGRGRIVFVGSISSTLGTAAGGAYCASKWGILGFMKSVAAEISGTQLSAVAVLPGSVDTAMLVGSPFPPRMTADDVAKTIVYQALDAPLAHNGGVVEMFGT